MGLFLLSCEVCPVERVQVWAFSMERRDREVILIHELVKSTSAL